MFIIFLHSGKQVFLRELISNALHCDACEQCTHLLELSQTFREHSFAFAEKVRPFEFYLGVIILIWLKSITCLKREQKEIVFLF